MNCIFVAVRNFIFVTYNHVAYVTCEVVANCFGESFLFTYQYRAIIIQFLDDNSDGNNIGCVNVPPMFNLCHN